jgi:hypothetical protein
VSGERPVVEERDGSAERSELAIGSPILETPSRIEKSEGLNSDCPRVLDIGRLIRGRSPRGRATVPGTRDALRKSIDTIETAARTFKAEWVKRVNGLGKGRSEVKEKAAKLAGGAV